VGVFSAGSLCLFVGSRVAVQAVDLGARYQVTDSDRTAGTAGAINPCPTPWTLEPTKSSRDDGIVKLTTEARHRDVRPRRRHDVAHGDALDTQGRDRTTSTAMTMPTLLMQRAQDEVMAEGGPTVPDKPRRRIYIAEYRVSSWRP
jgi:hypothetical protein